MALDAAYAKNLAAKAGPADDDEMVALGGDDDMDMKSEPDSDADDAVAQSAFDDFARAAGFKPSPKAYSALKELIDACMKG